MDRCELKSFTNYIEGNDTKMINDLSILFKKSGITLKKEWLLRSIDFSISFQENKERIFKKFLNSKFTRSIVESTILTNRTSSRLEGIHLVQLVMVNDISISDLQYKEMFDDKKEYKKKRRVLKMLLTDGVEYITAIEYQYIDTIPEDIIFKDYNLIFLIYSSPVLINNLLFLIKDNVQIVKCTTDKDEEEGDEIYNLDLDNIIDNCRSIEKNTDYLVLDKGNSFNNKIENLNDIEKDIDDLISHHEISVNINRGQSEKKLTDELNLLFQNFKDESQDMFPNNLAECNSEDISSNLNDRNQKWNYVICVDINKNSAFNPDIILNIYQPSTGSLHWAMCNINLLSIDPDKLLNRPIYVIYEETKNPNLTNGQQNVRIVMISFTIDSNFLIREADYLHSLHSELIDTTHNRQI